VSGGAADETCGTRRPAKCFVLWGSKRSIYVQDYCFLWDGRKRGEGGGICPGYMVVVRRFSLFPALVYEP
jgi:hypothetical protein